MEVWAIIECNNSYEVSDKGRIRKKGTNICKVLLQESATSVVSVMLFYNDTKKCLRANVKDLVAKAFLPECQFVNSKVINKNGNSKDCNKDNLEYINSDIKKCRDCDNSSENSKIYHGQCMDCQKKYDRSRANTKLGFLSNLVKTICL